MTTAVGFTDGLAGREIGDAVDAIGRVLKGADDDIQSVFAEVEKDSQPTVAGDRGE